jgi:hypothetical protein
MEPFLLAVFAGVPPMLRRRPELHGSPLAIRARLGGASTQLAYAAAHCLAHLLAAVGLLLLLELVSARVRVPWASAGIDERDNHVASVAAACGLGDVHPVPSGCFVAGD